MVALPVVSHIRCSNCWLQVVFDGAIEQARESARAAGWTTQTGSWVCSECAPHIGCRHIWRSPVRQDYERCPWIPKTRSTMEGTFGVMICDKCGGLQSYDSGD